MESFARDLGVDEVILKTDIFNLKPELKISHADIYNSIVKLQSKDSQDSFYQKDKEAGRNFCDFPWVYPTILADGQVVICCRDRYYESVVGKIGEQSFAQAWNAEGYREFRRKFLEDEIKPSPCHLCECRPKK